MAGSVTAAITIYCDQEMAYGSCPQSITLNTTDLSAARATAERFGWQLSDTGDRCALYHAPKPRPPAPTRLAGRGDR